MLRFGRLLSAIAALAITGFATTASLADQATRDAELKAAAEMVDTSAFKRDGPYKIGVSAGYMSNSWVVFCLQHIRWEASLHPEITEVIVTDAGFDPKKQVADIEDLLRQKVDLLLYWPVDDASIANVLKQAADAGVPTIQTGGGFTTNPGTTSNAFIPQYTLGELVARSLFADMKGEGKIIAMLPIAGTTAAVEQLAALNAVMKEFPKIELLSAEYGDWNRAKAKQITENLLQRYPRIDGVFSPAGQMSIGVAEAFEEAGRLSETVMSPGDEYNGWLKWVAQHGQGGAVTFPTRAGQVAVQLGLQILKGESVPRGVQVPSEYIAPADIAKYVDASAPDDWWATKIPPEFLPPR